MGTAPTNLSIFKELKVILAQMTPTREGPGAVIRTPTPEKQPPPWVRLVLCQSKVLSGLSCWRLRSPALKENVSSTQKSLTKQVQLFSHWVMVDSCDPVDCLPPGSSVHGILQARIPECVAIPFSKESF